ncbi:hypothetical protein HUJ05_001078, partial [Dendroctonus ponderosae]
SPTASSPLKMSTAVVDETSGRNSDRPRLQSPREETLDKNAIFPASVRSSSKIWKSVPTHTISFWWLWYSQDLRGHDAAFVARHLKLLEEPGIKANVNVENKTDESGKYNTIGNIEQGFIKKTPTRSRSCNKASCTFSRKKGQSTARIAARNSVSCSPAGIKLILRFTVQDILYLPLTVVRKLASESCKQNCHPNLN